jgi:branched-subunit amino acid ABC-type transport system permease component
MRLALMWHHATGGRGAKDMVVLPYKDRLVLMKPGQTEVLGGYAYRLDGLADAKGANRNGREATLTVTRAGDDRVVTVLRPQKRDFPVGAMATTWLLCRLLLASRFGRVLRAAKGNPLRVQALGFDPYPYRLVAYVIAGGIGGASGFLFANATEFVAPAYFSWQRSGELLFMVILGGVAGLHGALVGALGFVLLEEWLSHQWEHWRIIFGVLLILAVLYLPNGLSGVPAQILKATRRAGGRHE